MNKIDIIATDFDGTLLNAEHRISDYTMNVLKECMRRGIRIIGVSGRTQASMLPYILEIGANQPYIGANGGEIIGSDHRVIERYDIDTELLLEVLSDLERDRIYAQVYDENAIYFAEECCESRKYQSSTVMPGKAVGRLTDFIRKPSPKIVCIGDPQHLLEGRPYYLEKYQGRLSITSSLKEFMELLPAGVSKGNSLKRLFEIFHYHSENLIAFGDGENDINMLQYAAYGIAMGNARSQVKAAAYDVCPPNTEDGMARYLEEHILRG